MPWGTSESCTRIAAIWGVRRCPQGTAVLGGFESWSGVMGGLLDVAGVPGFLQDRPQFYAASDGERAAWSHFIRRWHETHGDRPVGVGDLFVLVTASHDPIALDLGTGSERKANENLKMISRERIFLKMSLKMRAKMSEICG